MSNDPSDSPASQAICQYFVDEAGDPNLFNGRKQVIIGQPGCSSYFILGALHIADSETVSQALNQLRTDLLADPYFKRVPSMQPQQKKYLEFVWPKVSLVHDVDDTRQKPYGRYYDRRRPLTLAACRR